MSRRLPVADLAGMNGAQAPHSSSTARPSLASLAQVSIFARAEIDMIFQDIVIS